MTRRVTKVFRDGKVHVLAEPCITCIFGPASPVPAARTRGMLAECERQNIAVPCHEFMDSRTPVVCHGLYETRRVGLLQVAERLGAVVFDDLPTPPEFQNGDGSRGETGGVLRDGTDG